MARMRENRLSASFIGTWYGREGTCAFTSNNASSEIERKCSIAARAGDCRDSNTRESVQVAASLRGELQPTIYRFKLGGFEVATVLDAKAIRDGLYPNYGANASVDDVYALARANNIDTQRFEHPNIPTIVNTGKELILFDTGNGALPREYEQLSKRLPPGQTAERLATAGYKPEDIDVIVLTHGHPDHIGGLTEGGKPVFAKARYVFGAAEFDFWKRGKTYGKRGNSIESYM